MKILYDLVSNKTNGSNLDLNKLLERTDIDSNSILSLNQELSRFFLCKGTHEICDFSEKIVANLYNARRCRGNTIFYDVKRNKEHISVKASNTSKNINKALHSSATKINSIVNASYGISNQINNNITKVLLNTELFDLDKGYRKIKEYFAKELKSKNTNRSFSVCVVWSDKKLNKIYIAKTRHIDSITMLNESLKEWHKKIKNVKTNKNDLRLSSSSVLTIFNGIRDMIEITLINKKYKDNKFSNILNIKNEINNKVITSFDEVKLKRVLKILN